MDSRISALTSRLNEQIKQQSESAAAAAIAAAGVMGGSKDNTGGVGIAAATVDCSTCKGMFIMPNGTQLTEEVSFCCVLSSEIKINLGKTAFELSDRAFVMHIHRS